MLSENKIATTLKDTANINVGTIAATVATVYILNQYL